MCWMIWPGLPVEKLISLRGIAWLERTPYIQVKLAHTKENANHAVAVGERAVQPSSQAGMHSRKTLPGYQALLHQDPLTTIQRTCK